MKQQTDHMQSNINTHFDNILSTLGNIENAAAVISRLGNLSEDVGALKKSVKVALNTLDNHFQAYLKQIHVLSELIEFQQEVIRFASPDEMVASTFRYLKSQINYDGAFIYIKSDAEEKSDDLLTSDDKSHEIYESFLTGKKTLSTIRKALGKKERAFFLEKESRPELQNLPWKMFGAKSTIIIPLRIQRNLYGFGVIYSRQEDAITIEQLSSVNVILGLLSLMIFQHYYFFHLKQRFLSQARLHKVFEPVKFGDFFDRGPLHIFSLDESGVILHANNTALQNTAFGHISPIGEKFTHFLPEDQQESFDNAINNIHDGELLPFHTPLFIQNGAMHVWNIFFSQMTLQQKFTLKMVIAVDVTAQHFREQVKARNEVLDQAADFSTVISRHLNDLLAVMVPNVSLMRQQLPQDHALQKHVSAMENTLGKTEQLTRKFLNYDLPEIETPRKSSLNKLIKQVVDHFQEKLSDHVVFKMELSDDVPAMQLYTRRLARLIKIFTKNSLEALNERENPQIQLNTRVVTVDETGLLRPEMYPLNPGSFVEMRFTDNGNGIKPELLPHIFKPFFSTKIKNDGTAGMGLFIAYNIVKELKGEIFVTSVPGQSTTFLIYLPLVEAPAKNAGKTISAAPAQNGKIAPCILVVDDEYNIRSVLQEILEAHGFRVLTAENGKEGVEVFEQKADEIDLVILDMRMPVMGGKEAFLEIKKRKNDQKVIIISGFAKREELQEIMRNGALGYLSKPFQIEDILKQVKSTLVH